MWGLGLPKPTRALSPTLCTPGTGFVGLQARWHHHCLSAQQEARSPFTLFVPL